MQNLVFILFLASLTSACCSTPPLSKKDMEEARAARIEARMNRF